MSVLTTTPLKSAPSSSANIAIAASGSTWVYGAWTEVIASTAAPIAIAGVQLGGGGYSATTYDIDFGVGAGGAETSIGTLRVYLYNSGSRTHMTGLFLPLPLGGVGAGQRVSVRVRCNGGSAGPAGFTLNYYENFDSAQVTTSSSVLTSAPSGSTTASMTPSATPWANSAWVELIASASSDIALLGLTHGPNGAAVDGIEFDLGTGGSGAETVITTLRQIGNVGRIPYSWLPGVYPITAGTRVAVRMRKSDTNTSAVPVSLIYYTNLTPTLPTTVRTTQAGLELAGTGTGDAAARTTQAGLEVSWNVEATPLYVTQAGLEVAWMLPVPSRVTMAGVEVAWVVPEVVLPESNTIGLVWVELQFDVPTA